LIDKTEITRIPGPAGPPLMIFSQVWDPGHECGAHRDSWFVVVVVVVIVVVVVAVYGFHQLIWGLST